MSAQQLISIQRSQLVATLGGGSVETFERLLDYLLSWDVLTWEEYENVSVVGHPLSKLVRDLLDIICCKCEENCSLFNDALTEAEKVHVELSPLKAPEDLSQLTQHLQKQRPQIVRIIHNYVDSVFQHLLEHDCISKYEAEAIRLPIFSTSQQARRLLDLLRVKNNETAQCLIHFINSLEKEAAPVPDFCADYQKKLKCTISAQTQFLSTYDGAENVCLEDIYIDSVLELSVNSNTSTSMQSSQNPMGFHDILNSQGIINKNADTILVLGDAGSGKSTLLQQIHNLWAEGKAFHSFAFIFPFSCRRLRCIGKEVSLKTLLFEHCCWPDNNQEDIFKFILDNPRQVLITFDGFDEFKFNFSEDEKHCSPTNLTSVKSVVFNLLQGNLMKDCIKILTSRPNAITTNMRNYIQKEVNLKGFSVEGIEMFMKKRHNDPKTFREIISLVKANSSLLSLCHIPVFCWIVSRCHKELILNGCSSPQTMTDMYILALQHFLQRMSLKKKFAENILKKRFNSIRHLGKLALHGLCHGLYVFSDQQIVDSEVNEDDISLGFLVLSKNFSMGISLPTQHYEFLHITFQCFFAALYVAMTDHVAASSLHKFFYWTKKPTRHPVVQFCVFLKNELLLKKIEKQNLQITASFISGLFSERLYKLLNDSWKPTKLPAKLVAIKKCLTKGLKKHFKSIPPAVEGEKKSMHAMPEFVWLLKCIYEMQDCSLAKKSVERLEVDHLKVTYCGVGPIECTALAFVLKHLKSTIGIQLDHNSIGDAGIEQLIPCLHICKSLYLRDNNISDKGICRLLEQAVYWENFQKIALFNNKLTDECAESFANLLQQKQNFLSIRLGNNYITHVGAKILAQGIKESKSLQFLGLWGNRVGDLGAQAIAEALQDSKSIIWVSMVGNDIGSAGAYALAAMLEKNTSLNELWLSNNHLGEMGVAAIAEALQHNSTFSSMWLKENNLTPEEVEKFRKMDHRLVF
ncbi:nucleotide-binding oligomerization domain-containing protein 2 [Bombina bombina]|uniref:nucleotide-binding oligomerization domain-containing protein 2 n=1 Tax=Bombina bombina TaxID=8345 RepID=UPI00235ABA5A|nr:nucleotide-binding oligomerization domain-containing protein 2 [Bombina bombina]